MTHLQVVSQNTVLKLVQGLEWLWILSMIVAFWHISPPIRDQYVFLLLFAIPFYGLRFVLYRRLWTRTPLDTLLILFFVVSIYNFNYSPLARADYWVLICRPLLGIFIIWHFVEHVRHTQHLNNLILATIFLSTLIGLVALVATQWTISNKSDDFAFIINLLPVLDHRQILPDMQLSFNPNEIAGVLAYACPFLLGIGLGSFRVSIPTSTRLQKIIRWMMTWGALIGFVIAFTALFLGQSRFALAGTFVGLLIVVIMILPNWRLRAIGMSLGGFFVVLEILLVLNIMPIDLTQSDTATTSSQPAVGLNSRDETTFTNRFDLWDRAIRMTLDYPTTGAGMSVYRAMVTRDEYIIDSYAQQGTRPPHAHNALFQMGADLGVIGWVLFVGWYGIVAWMAMIAYRSGNLKSKIMTIAISASILGHMGYGIGDTITLWDRFAFVHWWYIGLITAVYFYTKNSS